MTRDSSWLGLNDFNKKTVNSIADAYAEMYSKPNHPETTTYTKTITEEVIVDAYDVSDENAKALAEGKKKCKDGYEYDSDKKKCVKKEKKSKTVIYVGRGYGHHHHDHDDDDNDSDKNTGGDGDATGGDGGGE